MSNAVQVIVSSLTTAAQSTQERQQQLLIDPGVPLTPAHEAQLLNHLRATSIEVGLLLHFGVSASFRRFILTNDRKPAFAVSVYRGEFRGSHGSRRTAF